MSLSTRIELDFALSQVATSGDFPGVSSIAWQAVLGMATGTGLGLADVCFVDRARVLAQGTNEDLDLAAGGLLDPLGVAFAPARIKALYIRNNGPDSVLTLSRPAANGVPFLAAASDAIVLPLNGAALLWWPSAAGIAVTAGTGDLINVAMGAGTGNQNYDILIVGASA